MVTDTGSSRSPVWKASKPCTTCRYSGMVKNSPSRMRFWQSRTDRPERGAGLTQQGHVDEGVGAVGGPSVLPVREGGQDEPSGADDEQGRREAQDGEGRVAGLHPAPGAALQHTEHAQSQAGRRQRGADADAVHRGARAGPRDFGDHATEAQDGDDHHDLTGEDQPPGEVCRHPAAQQRADRDPRAGPSADDSVGDGPVLAPVGLGDEGGHGRQHHGRPEAFDDRPAQREDPQGGCHGGQGRADAVDHEAEEEEPAAAEDVAESAADDHEGGHDQRVQRDDGLDGGDLGVEVLDQLADGDVHDGRVQDHQELGRPEDDQSPPVLHGVLHTEPARNPGGGGPEATGRHLHRSSEALPAPHPPRARQPPGKGTGPRPLTEAASAFIRCCVSSRTPARPRLADCDPATRQPGNPASQHPRRSHRGAG